MSCLACAGGAEEHCRATAGRLNRGATPQNCWAAGTAGTAGTLDRRAPLDLPACQICSTQEPPSSRKLRRRTGAAAQEWSGRRDRPTDTDVTLIPRHHTLGPTFLLTAMVQFAAGPTGLASERADVPTCRRFSPRPLDLAKLQVEEYGPRAEREQAGPGRTAIRRLARPGYGPSIPPRRGGYAWVAAPASG